MYPLLFHPNFHPTIWGGERLEMWKGCVPSGQAIGESWEVSAVESSPSVVANGVWAGMTLDAVVREHPEEILGEKVAKRYGNKLPLLVKFIDANRDLSIQVHPNDEMAMREHGKFGKTEMWYILDAKPGAAIVAGFKDKITPEEYARRVADGTIVDVLARHEVKKGDVFYIPSGRVHAICGGIMLAEVQQSSDVTYRIYDYKRLDADGQPRQLHTELAAKAIDYAVHDEYRTFYDDAADKANHCIDSPFFSVRMVDIEGSFHRNLLKYDSFIITMCIKGDCLIKIRSNREGVILREGWSCLIPASIADYDVIPVGKSTQLLDAYIDNRPSSIFNWTKKTTK